jgi:pimeloyl-ACP methyl ester carboxylesterase
VWRTLQADLQKTHRGAPLILAADAGHQIPLDAPKLVAQVVSDVVAGARRSRPDAYGND